MSLEPQAMTVLPQLYYDRITSYMTKRPSAGAFYD
jgi:hypothetical protein